MHIVKSRDEHSEIANEYRMLINVAKARCLGMSRIR